MSETIKCEITNVKMFDNRASISIKAMGELPTDLENSKSYSDQYGLQYSQFLNDGDLPPYVKVGTKIAIPYYVNPKGYMALSKYDEVKVLEEASVVDEIKEYFPETTLENIPDGLDELEKETDFPYGANEKKPNGTDKLNGHSDDPVQAKINNYADLYAKIFATIHKHEYLAKLDTGLKKDIATSFFIQLNR